METENRAIGSSYVRKLGRSIKHNKFVTALFVAFLLSMLYGSFLISRIDNQAVELLGFLTKEYVSLRAGQSLLETFLSSALSSFSYLAILFLLGFFAIGQPLIFLVPVFRGFGLGITMGYLYSRYGLQAAGYCAVLIVPVAFFVALILINAAKDSLKMANLFLLPMVKGNYPMLTPEAAKIYLLKYFIYGLMTLGACILDALLNFLFSGFIVL